MIRPILLAGAVVALPSLAAAQGMEFDGTVTLGANFNSTDIAGTDVSLNGYSLDFDGDIHFDESFSVGVGAAYNTGTASIGAPVNADLNVDLMSFYVEPQYNFGNGGYVGAYLRMNDLDLSPGIITLGIDATSYGIFGGYDFGQGHVEAFYGMTELDDPSGAITGLEITDYGISGSYQVMPELEVFASVMRTDIAFSPDTIPVTAYSIGAEYDLGNGFDIYGAVGGLNADLSDLGAPDISGVGLTLGASYDLSASGSMPVILSAEYSRTNLDLDGLVGVSPEIDRFALGVTIPLGNGSSTPLNSNTRTARGDYRSALESVLNSF